MFILEFLERVGQLPNEFQECTFQLFTFWGYPVQIEGAMRHKIRLGDPCCPAVCAVSSQSERRSQLRRCLTLRTTKQRTKVKKVYAFFS